MDTLVSHVQVWKVAANNLWEGKPFYFKTENDKILFYKGDNDHLLITFTPVDEQVFHMFVNCEDGWQLIGRMDFANTKKTGGWICVYANKV